MRTDLERSPDRTPILRKVGAGLILVVAAALAIHLVLSVATAIFWTVVTIAVVVAVVWALKTLIW